MASVQYRPINRTDNDKWRHNGEQYTSNKMVKADRN